MKLKSGKSPFKTRKKYRLTFVNENTFNAVWSVKLSRTKVWILAVTTVCAISALILLLFTLTPLSVLLPGYLKPSQRAEHYSNVVRVDSLADVVSLQDNYLRNIENILSGKADAESDTVCSLAPVVTDTLMATSQEEKQFIEQWNARQSYAVGVMTPIAADAISLHSPCARAVARSVINDDGALSLPLTVMPGSVVTAPAAGTVVDIHRDDTKEYVVTIQHRRNMLSTIGGLHTVYVGRGRTLQAGTAIGDASAKDITLSLWLDGVSLDPRTLINF